MAEPVGDQQGDGQADQHTTTLSGSSTGPNGVSRSGRNNASTSAPRRSARSHRQQPDLVGGRQRPGLQRPRAGQLGRERKAQRDRDEVLRVGHLTDVQDREQHVDPEPSRNRSRHGGRTAAVATPTPPASRRRSRRRSRWPAGTHSQPPPRKIRKISAISSTASTGRRRRRRHARGAEVPLGEAAEQREQAGDEQVVDRVQREEVAPDEGVPAAVLERRQPVPDVRVTRTARPAAATTCRQRPPAAS